MSRTKPVHAWRVVLARYAVGVHEERNDDRVSLEGLDPVAALKTLLAVDPQAPPVSESTSDDEFCPKRMNGARCRLKRGHLGPCQFNL
jgi:hypothetical protein